LAFDGSGREAHGLRSLANHRNIILDGAVGTGKTKYRPYFENYTVDASILEAACMA